MSEKVFGTAKDLKIGKYVLIDGVPCKVVEIDISKPGKHGAAKMRVTAIGIFNGQKKTLLTPSDADVEIPIIERKTVQVMSVSGDSVQIMDPNTYDVYDIPLPSEFQGKVEAGMELEIIEWGGNRKIERTR